MQIHDVYFIYKLYLLIAKYLKVIILNFIINISIIRKFKYKILIKIWILGRSRQNKI